MSSPSDPSQDRSFLLRRLHSLSGVFPVGAFLLEHLYTNAYAINGPQSYNEQVRGLTELPGVILLETIFIYIPIAFHSLYGIWIWWRGTSNLKEYPWVGNWMYALQRWTGLIAFAYIGFHVWEQRFAGEHIIGNYFIAFSKVQHSIARPPVHIFYVMGLVAACFHFAYGLWLFAAKWGLVPGTEARRKLAYACGMVFLILCATGLASLRSFSTAPLQPPPRELIRMHVEQESPPAPGKGG